jgi:hypothetical protein
MAPPSWTNGEQTVFLLSRSKDYEAAARTSRRGTKNMAMAAFLNSIVEAWHEKYAAFWDNITEEQRTVGKSGGKQQRIRTPHEYKCDVSVLYHCRAISSHMVDSAFASGLAIAWLAAPRRLRTRFLR